MSYTHVRRGGWVTNAALTLGFLALTAALVSARTNPAVGYEVSVYRATPVAVWAGLGVAFVVSLVVSLFERSRLRWVGLALGGTAALTVFALPLIRGYYYYGANDAMTHLGWVRDLEPVYAKSSILLRIPRHDSLSVMVIEIRRGFCSGFGSGSALGMELLSM